MALRDMAHLVYAYQDMGPIRPAQSELGNQEISRPCHLGKLSKLAKLGKCQETVIAGRRLAGTTEPLNAWRRSELPRGQRD
jgi:hypothetical protein